MGAVLRQRTTSLLSRMFAATKLYCRAAKLARQRLDAAVVHDAHRLQRRSVQAWVGHVTKRRRKAALEAAALQSHRSRLLLHGCRGWLQGGMKRRTARVEVDTQVPSQLVLFSPDAVRVLQCVLDAEGQRAKALMVTVERLARHWRNKTLHAAFRRRSDVGSRTAVSATSTIARVSNLAVYPSLLPETCDLQPAPPALADACYVPAQRVAAVPTIPPPRSRPSPRRPPLLFGESAMTVLADSARMSARIAPSPSPAAPVPAPEKTRPTTTAPDVASLDLDGMEAILAGFRELKELKEGARQALLPLAAQHDALSTVCREGSSGHECAPHPAIHKHSHFADRAARLVSVYAGGRVAS